MFASRAFAAVPLHAIILPTALPFPVTSSHHVHNRQAAQVFPLLHASTSSGASLLKAAAHRGVHCSAAPCFAFKGGADSDDSDSSDASGSDDSDDDSDDENAAWPRYREVDAKDDDDVDDLHPSLNPKRRVGPREVSDPPAAALGPGQTAANAPERQYAPGTRALVPLCVL